MTSSAGRAAHPNAGQTVTTQSGPRSRTSPPGPRDDGQALPADPPLPPRHVNGKLAPTTISERVDRANQLAREAQSLLPWDDPIGAVQWVHHSKVHANDYNPNSVANQEMKLLHVSISSDGYTQPIVCIQDQDRFVIVDGFHRWTVMRKYADITQSTHGYLPIVVLHKSIADRMASTIRHNRARGKHSVAGMGSLIFGMLEQGETDEEICNKLGMEAGELSRLKHITGYSKLFATATHSPLVQTRTQNEYKADYKKAHPDEEIPPW